MKQCDYEQIGKRIRGARAALHISQEKAAELCEITASYYGNLERGEKILSVDTLSKISKALHISTDYLLFGEPKNANDEFYSFISEITEKYQDKEIIRLTKIMQALLPVIDQI